MAKDQPKIWCSMAWTSTLSIRHIGPPQRGVSYKQLTQWVEQNKAYIRGELINPEDFPSPLSFTYRYKSEKKKSSHPDLFTIFSSHIVISPKIKGILEEFDIGKTQMFPVTVYEYDQVTPRPEEYFVLNIAEAKDGFAPDQTTGHCEQIGDRWTMMDWAVPAVRPSAAEGRDLWVDENTREIFFLSDRLVRRLKKEKVTGLRLKQCLIVD